MEQNILLLPIIGAFIGYFTNYIAIKMLFLPKKPYFIFGIRIPFTPGLIPKKRTELINKIANVVSSKIVNKKDIIKYIYKKRNRAFLYQFSTKLFDSILSKKISSLNINYDKIETTLTKFLENNLKELAKEHLKNFKIDIDYITYNAFLTIDKNKKIEEYLSKEQKEQIEIFIKSLTDKSLIKLTDTMDSQETKQLIKIKIKKALEKYSDDSNILMASIIGMISPLIEDSETIPNIIIEELKSVLTDDTIKEKTADSVIKSVKQEILNRNPDYVLEKLNLGSLENIRKLLTKKLDELATNLSFNDKIINSTIDNIDKEKLAKNIISLIKKAADSYTFYDILKITKPDIVDKLPSMAVNNLLFVLKKESDMIFNFDISKIAKEKLEKFDISEIEDVVLNISKDQFKYINIFGGILGFVIGSIEVLIRF